MSLNGRKFLSTQRPTKNSKSKSQIYRKSLKKSKIKYLIKTLEKELNRRLKDLDLRNKDLTKKEKDLESHKKELEEKIDEVREEERAKHSKELNEQRKTYEHRLAESESARDHLKQTIKEKNATLKTINDKFGDYIKEQITQEKTALEAKKAEQRRQQREREAEQRRQQREQDRGMDFDW